MTTKAMRGTFQLLIVQDFTESKTVVESCSPQVLAQKAVGNRRYNLQPGEEWGQEDLANLVMVTCPYIPIFTSLFLFLTPRLPFTSSFPWVSFPCELRLYLGPWNWMAQAQTRGTGKKEKEISHLFLRANRSCASSLLQGNVSKQGKQDT